MLNRRDFLLASAFGGLGALGVGACESSTPSPGSSGPGAVQPGGAPQGAVRRLVVVELRGGNDGLSTLVPDADARYHELRPSTAIPAEHLVDLGGGWALAKGLDTLRERGLALVQGVGAATPDLSHFEMMSRWWAGTPDASSATQALEGSNAGALGRICDRIGGDELLTGVSLGFGPSAMLRSDRARVIGVDGAELPELLSTEGVPGRLFRTALSKMGQVAGGAGLSELIEVATALGSLPETPTEFPDHGFGRQVLLASRILRSDLGVRVVHVPMDGGSFDTHERHVDTHVGLMDELGTGLAALLADLDAAGAGDGTLVVTTSEFGRRAGENSDGGGAGGLDHGTASTVLACGAVPPGTNIHGDAPSLRDLDDTDNLVATSGFDRWFATMAAWLDVDPAAVLAGAPRPWEGVVRA